MCDFAYGKSHVCSYLSDVRLQNLQGNDGRLLLALPILVYVGDVLRQLSVQLTIRLVLQLKFPRLSTKMRKMRSKRESSAVGRLMFSPGVFFTLYLPKSGFAAQRSETRAFSVV